MLFLQRDPEGYRDSVNLYAGFRWDTVNMRDPTGRSSHGSLKACLDDVASNYGGSASLQNRCQKLYGGGEQPGLLRRAWAWITGANNAAQSAAEEMVLAPVQRQRAISGRRIELAMTDAEAEQLARGVGGEAYRQTRDVALGGAAGKGIGIAAAPLTKINLLRRSGSLGADLDDADDYIAFAHGTSASFARAIARAGPNRKKSIANMTGSHEPGSFFTHLVGPPGDPGPGLQNAANWASGRYPGNSAVLIGRMKKSDFAELEARGLVRTRPVSPWSDEVKETIFKPGAFRFLRNKTTWQVLDIGK